MFMFNRVKIDNKINKIFDYSKGKVRLSFSLRTDIKDQLKDFLELLKIAIEEVKEEINK